MSLSLRERTQKVGRKGASGESVLPWKLEMEFRQDKGFYPLISFSPFVLGCLIWKVLLGKLAQRLKANAWE
ncbi:Hypothetical protein Minf_2226 [Methylacidiphilum infernorum V4]|uniref:Uncharacterized protein n=1 Tax=Methylacidiphilum infernorum (isolate V4) TaxID=481448 RepID=B3DZU5_METI4|nr:Hypothetical protein Minf_2226 [Methylacidiphilum infernorum V4]